jgi:hypothetical protein
LANAEGFSGQSRTLCHKLSRPETTPGGDARGETHETLLRYGGGTAARTPPRREEKRNMAASELLLGGEERLLDDLEDDIGGCRAGHHLTVDIRRGRLVDAKLGAFASIPLDAG